MRSFAILGCGHAGARHAEILSQYGRLVACVDPNLGAQCEKIGDTVIPKLLIRKANGV